MHPRNSSISSSDGARGQKAKRWRTLLWALFWLIMLDVAASMAFAYPADVKNVNPGQLPLFFDYGRSMEGRLRRMTRANPRETAPITLAGWYRPLQAVDRPAKPGGFVVTIYGMSHAVRLADALERVSQRYSARSIGAPGATTNWSFGAFRRDVGRRRSRVVVLALMSSTLPNITSLSPMTWNTSFPLPYTQDRYLLNRGRLTVIVPPYDSFGGYVATLSSPQKWASALEVFKRYDPFYEPWLFKATPLDHSALVRMARRGWGNRRDREQATAVLSKIGFDANSEPIRLANAIILAFATEARRDGQLPVIYLVNNLGYGNQLRRAMQQTLDKNQIPYLSSDSVVDPSDPSNYLPDTHFTNLNDEKLAIGLDRLITDRLKSNQDAASAFTRVSGRRRAKY